MIAARQAFLFCLVGGANTIIGLAMIFALMWLGINDLLANLSGYVVGFLIGYALNAKVTFSQPRSRSGAVKYVLLMLVCYCLNLVVMILLRDTAGVDRYLAQIAGMMTYTGVGFLGSRFLVFRPNQR